MEYMWKKLTLALAVIAVLGGLLFYKYSNREVKQTQAPSTQAVLSATPTPPPERFSYAGQEGKDALALLKEKMTVEQDNSGLVVSINGRKVDATSREFWAFYVNGEMAPVGPADYQTKEGDTIEWRIEKY